jgi:hypothetical protein
MRKTGVMTPPRIPAADGHAAVLEVLERLKAVEPVETIDRSSLALAVRYLLQQFADAHPGHAVEVRVPPLGAVQAVEGPRHTRGTPANVVELAPTEWVQLATGCVTWTDLVRAAKLSASGVRSDISELLPLAEW